MTRRLTPLRDLQSLWALYRLMRRERFTIVHAHNPKPGLLAQVAARLAGVPVVVNTLHGFYFHDGMGRWPRRFYRTLEKVAALCSDVVLSQNEEDVLTAVREGIVAPHRIKLLGNGIDLRRFDASSFRETPVASCAGPWAFWTTPGWWASWVGWWPRRASVICWKRPGSCASGCRTWFSWSWAGATKRSRGA